MSTYMHKLLRKVLDDNQSTLQLANDELKGLQNQAAEVVCKIDRLEQQIADLEKALEQYPVPDAPETINKE